MSDTHTWMKNPETNDIPWACPNALVDLYIDKRGWELCDDPDAEPDVEVSGFNPADHTVEEVHEHIDANEDSPGEVERVLELERAGKNRKSLVGDQSPEK
jgi:hypothetical protein